MRWFLGLAALAVGAWYVSNRQRRGQLQQTVRDAAPPDLQARVQDATTAASNAARSAAGAATQQAQGLARQASQAAGDAAASVQQTSEGVTDRARQATDAATETAHQAVDTAAQAARQATDTAASATQQATDAVAGATQQAIDTIAEAARQTGATAPARTGPEDAQQPATTPTVDQQETPATTGSAVETDVNTPPPSIRETVQAELADVNERVDSLRARAEAPPDPAEKSAGEFFGVGSMATTDVHAAQAPSTRREAETVEGGVEPLNTGASAGASGTGTPSTARDTAPAATPGAATGGAPSCGARSTVGRTLTTDDDIVPEGERPRPIAGEGTTTTAAGLVDTLSAVSDGQTATGAAEPLPRGLTAGAPGTGGPAASTIAPTTPNDAESPTTGMQTAPVVDRAAEVAERTSGKFIGNKKTRKVHLATSSDLPGESNRVYFESGEEATAAGFTPAPNEDLDEA